MQTVGQMLMVILTWYCSDKKPEANTQLVHAQTGRTHR